MRPLPLLALFVLPALTVAQRNPARKAEALTKVDAILAAPKQFARRIVSVPGRAYKFENRTSRAGNPYFVFELKDGKGTLNVYGRGKQIPALRNGQQVTVRGEFLPEKRMGKRVFRNEITVLERGAILIRSL